MTMRRKNFFKVLLWLTGVCGIALGYIFFRFHSKIFRLQHLVKSTTLADNLPTIISKSLINGDQTASDIPTRRAAETTRRPADTTRTTADTTQSPANPTRRSTDPTRRPARRSLLIFGHDRSGTTFISAMFAKDPKIFMVYEPLWITQRWDKCSQCKFNCSLQFHPLSCFKKISVVHLLSLDWRSTS